MHRLIGLFVFVACHMLVQGTQKQADCAPAELVAGSPSDSSLVDPAPQDGSRPLVVVSLNMAGKTDWEEVRAGFESLQEAPRADIYLLQEFVKDSADLLGTASSSLGYHYMFSGTEKCGDGCLKGVAILSRFPLLDQEVLELPRNNLRYNLRCRIALGATAETRLGRVRVYSLHLDTRINSRRRVRQLGPVFDQAAEFSGPVLIAGDFNTANVLYIRSVIPIPFLQLQGRAVCKAMRARGFQTPFLKTRRTFSFPPLKLDWIYLRGLEAAQRGVADIEFSDHRALWALLEKAR
ncbi:MAG: endonuclease/exonuclease/phosphatase family protein [Acidobacteriota bacterium]